MPCSHQQTTDIRERCYTGSVSRHDENPAAHGGICVTEECTACGARRDVNINGCHQENGSWGPTRREREQRARVAEGTVRELLACRPAPITVTRGDDTCELSIADDGFILATRGHGRPAPTAAQVAVAAPAFFDAAQSLRFAVAEAKQARGEV